VSRNRGRAGRNATYLKLEKPRFLFLEGWGGTSIATTGASAVPAVASDDPATGGSVSASGVDFAAAPSACGDGGAGCHLGLWGWVRSSSLSSSSKDEFANTGRGERPCFLRCQYSLLY
jgi:hypothetical protein